MTSHVNYIRPTTDRIVIGVCIKRFSHKDIRGRRSLCLVPRQKAEKERTFERQKGIYPDSYCLLQDHNSITVCHLRIFFNATWPKNQSVASHFTAWANDARSLGPVNRELLFHAWISPDAEESIARATWSWIELIRRSCSLLGHLPTVHGFSWRLPLFLVITTHGYILHGVIHKRAV
jgi:hypothetical protein